MGGLLKEVPLNDIIFGSESKLVESMNFKANGVDYTDYYWKTGDAILYNPDVTPLLEKSSLFSNYNPLIQVGNGNGNSKLAGKVLTMNSYPYPNRLFKVLSGLKWPSFNSLSTVYLPFRCSTVNFNDMDVYTWMQNEPAKADVTAPITTLDMNTLAIQK